MRNITDLKEIVFFRANAEKEAYDSMRTGYTEEERNIELQRYLSAYQIIEEADLVNEYEVWKIKNREA